MKLFAISDLHVDHRANLEALHSIKHQPDAGLITGGDLCTRPETLRETFDILCERFGHIFWVPGNHELWSCPKEGTKEMLHGVEKYLALVDVCREYGVHSPEDPFITWTHEGTTRRIAPLFIPYDYSFRPDGMALEEAVPWAMESGVLCSDERLMRTTPYENVVDWCKARVDYSRSRLAAFDDGIPYIIVNHFPLKQDMINLKRIPRFIIWCGTKLTETFHTDYPVKTVISGHLHMRATYFRDQVRFEEVSLGYPRDWQKENGVDYYFRTIMPEPEQVPVSDSGPIWRFF